MSSFAVIPVADRNRRWNWRIDRWLCEAASVAVRSPRRAKIRPIAEEMTVSTSGEEKYEGRTQSRCEAIERSSGPPDRPRENMEKRVGFTDSRGSRSSVNCAAGIDSSPLREEAIAGQIRTLQ